VAADGNWSKVRRICEERTDLHVESEEWGVRLRYMLAPDPSPSSRMPDTVDGSVHYVLGADGYVCQQPNGDWSVSMSDPTGENDDWLLSEDSSAQNIARLRELCEAKASPFAEHLLTSDEIYRSHFSCKTFDGKLIKCSTLAPVDWVGLVGDAGHAVAPYTGEGSKYNTTPAPRPRPDPAPTANRKPLNYIRVVSRAAASSQQLAANRR
jgi:2-polyprenyl-6-methoxyphenol hydroxylase-like FAD-dependent oxidoreductase